MSGQNLIGNDTAGLLIAAQLSQASYIPLATYNLDPTVPGHPSWAVDSHLPAGWYADTANSISIPNLLGQVVNQFIVFVNPDAHQVVIAFKGSDSTQNFESDLTDDGYDQYNQLEPSATAVLYGQNSPGQADYFTGLVNEYAGWTIVTDGHSLGGGMAQTFAVQNNLSGYGQNSLPIPPQTIADNKSLFNSQLSQWQASQNSFAEQNLSGDVATAFYYGGVYLAKYNPTGFNNPAPLPTPLVNAIQTALGTFNFLAHGYMDAHLLTAFRADVFVYAAQAHELGNVITALQQRINGNPQGGVLSNADFQEEAAILKSIKSVTTNSDGSITIIGKDNTQYNVSPTTVIGSDVILDTVSSTGTNSLSYTFYTSYNANYNITNSTNAVIGGDGNTIVAGGNDKFIVEGTNNVIDPANSTFELVDNITVTIEGSGNNISVGNNDNIILAADPGQSSFNATIDAADTLGVHLTTDDLNFEGQSIRGMFSNGQTDSYGRTYSLSGSTLTITGATSGDSLTISNFQNGDFGVDFPAPPPEIFSSGGQLLVTAPDATQGADVLKDFGDGRVYDLAQFGSNVLFTATDSNGYSQLWTTDGTEAGTIRLTNDQTVWDLYLQNNSYANIRGFAPGFIGSVNGHEIMEGLDAAGDFEIFSFNGTTLTQLSSVDVGIGGISGINQGSIITVNGTSRLAFSADGNLWITDGSQITELAESGLMDGDMFPGSFASLGNITVFGGFDADNIRGVWVTDGSSMSEIYATESHGPDYGLSAGGFTTVGDKVLFSGFDANGFQQLYVTNGTTAGTVALTALNGSSDHRFIATDINGFGGNRALILGGNNDQGFGLWISDGTVSGTIKLSGAVAYNTVRFLTVVGDIALFSNNTNELWVTDGTMAGTHMIAAIPGINSIAVDGTSAIVSSGGTDSLWQTDGTVAGTVQITTQLASDNGVGFAALDTSVFTSRSVTQSNSTTTIAAKLSEQLYGNGNTITAAGGDTLTVEGNGNTITTSAGGNDILIDGESNVLTAYAGDTVTVTGNGQISNTANYNTVSLSSGTLTVDDAASLIFSGSGNTVVLGDDDDITITGTGNTLSMGEGDVVTLSGHNTISGATDAGAALSTDTIIFDGVDIAADITLGASNTSGAYALSGTTLTITEGGDVVTINNFSNGDYGINITYNETVDNGTQSVAGNANATITGSGNTITLAGNDVLTLTGDSNTVNLSGTGSSVSITGSGETVNDTGSANAITLTGDGTTGANTLNASSDTLTIADNLTVSINGSGNTIIDANDIITLTGNNNTLTAGTGDTVSISGTGNNVTVTGDSVNVTDDSSSSSNSYSFEGNNDTATLSGTGDTVDMLGTAMIVNASNAAVTVEGSTGIAISGANNSITLGSSDSLAVAGTGDTINAASGADLTTDTLTFDGAAVSGNAVSGSINTLGNSYVLNGSTLTVTHGSDTLTINNFVNGDFGLNVSTAPAYTVTTFTAPGMSKVLPFAMNAGEIFGRVPTGMFADNNGSFTFFGASNTEALGANNNGVIVGYSFNNDGTDDGLVDNNGTITSLDYPNASYTVLQSVNDSGEIVGWTISNTDNENHGLIDIGGTLTSFDVPGAAWTIITGINNNGVLVGAYGLTDNDEEGFIDDHGVITTLNYPGTTGVTMVDGINDAGEVVGTFINAQGQQHSFVYQNGVYTQLNVPASSGTATTANGINDAGQVVGYYTATNGSRQGFLANPTGVNLVNGTGASLTVADATTETISGNDNTVTAGAGDTLTLYGNRNAISLGNGSTITVTGSGNTVNVAAGAQVTVNGSGVAVTGGAGAVVTVNETSGASKIEAFAPSSTVLSTMKYYTGTNGTGTLASETIDLADGTSKQEVFTNLASTVSEEVLFYSGADLAGTLTKEITDYTAGNSQLELFAPSSTIVTNTKQYSGPNGTGTLTSQVIDYTDGTSRQNLFTGLPTGTSEESLFYNGADMTGVLAKELTDYAAGNSVMELFNPSSTIVSNTKYYDGLDGTGTLTSQTIDYTNGTSQQKLFTNLPSGVTQESLFYSGLDLTGSLTKTILDYANGSSVIERFNPSSTVLSHTSNYDGMDGTGNLTSETYDMADGTSRQYLYTNLPSGVSAQKLYYSAADLTGTLTKEITDYTNGTSTVELFNSSSTILTNTKYYSGLDGTGTLTSQTIDYTDGTSRQMLYTGLPAGVSEKQINYSAPDLTGAITSTNFIGTSGNDTLTATATKQILTGNGGYDTYQFGRGDGLDTIRNGISTNTGPTGELDLATGIATNQIWFEQKGNNLQVDILGTTDHITVANWYTNSYSQLSEIKTAGGSMIDAQLQQLVQAMASYSSAHSSFNPSTATTMPTDTALQSALAAAWHS